MSFTALAYLETNDPGGELANALAKFRGLVPSLQRNAEGEYGPYTDMSGVWESIREPLSECGLSVRQPVVSVDADGGLAVVTTVAVGNAFERSVVLVPRESDEVWADVTTVARHALIRALGLASSTNGNATDERDGMSKGARVGRKRKQVAKKPHDKTVELAVKALKSAQPDVKEKYMGVLKSRVERGQLSPEEYRAILQAAGMEEEENQDEQANAGAT